MAVDSNPFVAGQGGRRVLYPGPGIVVTEIDIRTAEGQYLVRDLHQIRQHLVYSHMARTVSLIGGVIEFAFALPFAVRYGWLDVVCAGAVVATGLVLAMLIDARRNPRSMSLRAVHKGRPVVLFETSNRQTFGQVRRAVMRAVEANTPPLP